MRKIKAGGCELGRSWEFLVRMRLELHSVSVDGGRGGKLP